MYLYNIHCHNTGVKQIGDYEAKYIVSTTPSQYSDFAKQKLDNWFSCGIHPWDVQNADTEFIKLEEIALNKDIVAIGEAGLDKLCKSDFDLQLKIFKQQIELANHLQKPLIIHCVKAWDEIIALHNQLKPSTPCIIHGYRGNPQQTVQLSKQGFKFSIGEKFNKESLHLIAQDALFCETDTSTLSICQIYEAVAKELLLDLDQFVRKTENNVKNIFF